jgi:hypothetical protein
LANAFSFIPEQKGNRAYQTGGVSQQAILQKFADNLALQPLGIGQMIAA